MNCDRLDKIIIGRNAIFEDMREGAKELYNTFQNDTMGSFVTLCQKLIEGAMGRW